MSTPAPEPRDEQQELLQFIYLMPVAIVRLGATGSVEMLNPKAVQLLQDLDIDVQATDGPAILDALLPGLAATWRASAGRLGAVMRPQRSSPQLAQRATLHLQLQLVRPDRHCTMLAIEDVTVTVEQERELMRQRRRIGVILEHIRGYGAAMLDLHGQVSEWNPSIGRLLDLGEPALVGRELLGLVATDAGREQPAPAFAALAAGIARDGWSQFEAPWRRSDGTLLWGDCVIAPVIETDGATSGYVAVIRDVTDEHRRTLQLIDEALTDPLTGLCNRRALEQRVDALRRRSGTGPLAVTWIAVDIDHFKHVNDSVGHDGGDAVLKAVAHELQAAARDSDTVARIGGEEFVLMLPGLALAGAAGVAERLRLRIAALIVPVGERNITVTASFGVAQQADPADWPGALERADAALYRAKHGGRNRVELAPVA